MRRPRGSSPLARGLPPGQGRRQRVRGDHPRSRGVYSRTDTPLILTAGSSPLARGLRRRGHGGEVPRRIIPARAGFTRPWRSSTKACMDHPRSRGVYPTYSKAETSTGGSSPLARGLHGRRELGRRSPGIIPARAGFTCSTSTTSPPPWDHPRSRGVYPDGRRYMQVNAGSSPLARGLRVGDRGEGHGDGIIPARAGFTFHVLADERDV